MLAVKHLDPVIGVDVHIVMIPSPAGPIPTPIPHPFVGMVFDPMDYLPKVGATVMVNGLPRAHAGSAVLAMPAHIPMGGMFMKPPGNEGELFMGSSTVLVDGEPMTYSALPALTCTDIGIPAPLRAGKKGSAKSLLLPTSTVMAIPAGGLVMIGGAPTISMPGPEILIGPVVKRLGKQMGKAKQLGNKLAHLLDRAGALSSRYLNKVADRVFDKLKLNKEGVARNAVGWAICTVTGHPVDVASGKLFTNFVDLELCGPLPYKLERIWYSTSTYLGPLGHGWHASFDMALAEDEQAIGVRLDDGRMALFPALTKGRTYFHPDERVTLHRDEASYRLHNARSGLTHHFRKLEGAAVLPLARIESRDGHVIRFHYDEYARLHEIVDSGGRSWELVYEPSSRRVRKLLGPHPEREGERVVYLRYAYDDLRNLCEVRDALAQPQRFTYARHLLKQETNRNGLSFYFEYDGKDEGARCVRTWGDGGIYDRKLTYGHVRKITTVENSLGFRTQHEHDGAMVHRTIDAFGNTRRHKFTEGYRVLEYTDELGHKTVYGWDPRGNLQAMLSPDGAAVAMVHDANDLPVTITDARGGEWSWKRDEHGRIIEKANPLGELTRYEYRGAWLTAAIDPVGARTQLAYDQAGNLSSVTAPNGGATHFEYDRLGRLISVRDANQCVRRCVLDLLGRPVRINEPDGNVRQLAYDGEGNLTRVQDRTGDVRFTYQGMGRMVARAAANTVVRFTYDTEEQLTGVINEHGAAHRFVLGPTGQVDAEHGFDRVVRSYVRDAAGRITRVNRPEQRFNEIAYDAMGRVISVKHSDGGEDRFSYDFNGALVEAANDVRTVRFERDALGRVVEEWQDNHVVQNAHDPRGLRVELRSSLGAQQAFERDVSGNVLRVRAADRFEATFVRDLLGRELERSLPGGLRSRWRRDALGHPLEHVVSAGDQTLRAVGYKWGTDDRLVAQLDAFEGPLAYRHDALGNLTGATRGAGAPELRIADAVGNLFRTEHRADRTYGSAGQLLVSHTSEGATRYAYDAEGNLVEKREPDGRVWLYRWSAAGMLRKVRRPDGSTVTFAYDALGRRIAKTYRGQTTHWVWDGAVPLHEWVEGELVSLADSDGVAAFANDSALRMREAELDWLLAQGPPVRGSKQEPLTWLFEPASYAPMAKLSAAGAHSIVCDHLGTPALMGDAEGNCVWSAQLSTWGELLLRQGDRFACPFRWPGQYEDAETGLYYNRFRYYEPSSGQYTSRDPFPLLGGLHQHAYVSDPSREIDPLGLYAGEGVRTLGEFLVHFQTTLDKSEWPKERPDHFRAANKALHDECVRNPAFAETLESKYPGVLKHAQPGKAGEHLKSSPPNLTWHHNSEPGLMQLVDRQDHRNFHKVYHPDGSGGHAKWGNGCKK
jgi:RHS repeat-associated protein